MPNFGTVRQAYYAGGDPESAVVIEHMIAEFGPADADGVLQASPEYGSSSPGELEMTLSTSLVAVCCSSDSERSSVRWRSSLSSRAFSMAIDGLGGEVLDQLDLLVGERPHLDAVDDDGAKRVAFAKHRDADED